MVGRPAAHTIAEAIRFCFPFGGVPLASLAIGQAGGPFASVVRIGGVLLLTDMFGGTPSNLAISCMGQPNVEVLAGINMPMLVKFAKIRGECPLEEAVAAAQAAGRKYVTIASRVLAGK
mgnify:CR=1 FL=1